MNRLADLAANFYFNEAFSSPIKGLRQYKIPVDVDEFHARLSFHIVLDELRRIETECDIIYFKGKTTIWDAYGAPMLEAVGIKIEDLGQLSLKEKDSLQRFVRYSIGQMQHAFHVID